ncbi:MAG TPA: DUF1217 domain-containing protein [Roseiarcus sp.]|nr:DUF1217 domain-containing protein [Roseiarcus sp.]
MTTTTATYLAVSQNLSRYQTMTADQGAVKTASKYYAANIGKVTSIKDFVGNFRLLSYALDAYGLGNEVNSTALVTQVLEGGVSNPKSLANTLSNPNWAKFAAAFNFVGKGAASASTASAIKTTTNDYVEQQLETDQGQQDPGVQLALYFQRVAPTVSSAYGIMGDVNLLDVVQTIFGLPPETAGTNIDAEASEISKLVPMSTLRDPAKLQQLTERFTAMYDATYGPGSTAAPLTISSDGNSSAPVSAATTILSGVISANSSYSGLASSAAAFSSDMMASLQGLTLGG